VPSGADGRANPGGEGLVERVDGIAAWINDLDGRVRAAELATSDEKTAKELRRAVEALSKHDPKLEKRLTNRVDVLADRLATLAATVSTTAASLARKDGEIAALRKDLDEGGKRLQSLVVEFGKSAAADEVEKLRAAIRAVQAERPARTSDARVDNLGAKVDYLTERVDTLAKTVATTAAGLVGREGEIATLRQRLDEGSARLEQTSVELRRMQSDGAGTRRLDALKVALDATNERLAGRENEVAALRSRIDEAYSRVGTVVAELQGSLTTLSSQVRALEALPDATDQALSDQAAELNVRVDGLAEQVVAVASTVETVLSGLGERDEEIAALTRRVDEASERADVVVAELRQALAELPAPGTVEGEVESRLAELSGSLLAVTEQLTALAASSSAHSDATEARGAALERLLADAGERLAALESDRDAVVEQLAQASSAWSQERGWVRARLEELAAAEAEASSAHEGFTPVLETLSARLASMESDHAAATAEIVRVSSALEAERRSLHAQLDALAEASAANVSTEDVEGMLSQLTGRIESLEEGGTAVASEIVRVSAALDAERDTLHAQLDRVEEALVEAKASTRGGEAEQAVSALAARLQSVEEQGAAATSEIARLSTTLDAERESLHTQLDGIATSLALATTPGSPEEGGERKLAELGERLQTLEESGAAVASEIARTAALWASELEAIEARLDRVTGTLGQGATGVHAEDEQFLAELPARLDAMERDRRAVATELTRASDAWQGERSSLEARLGEISNALAEAESRATAASAGEVGQLRVALDGLHMRLASSEQELASLVGTRDTGARLDELTRRLESLERAPVVIAGTVDGSPLPGDGRFRLELRALELRMEHAEAAARENREAVLVQLERLAARIEWRFQRLESEFEAAHPQAVGGGGQVVPLRPTET
jgi:chromosome segregation ATPase